MTGHCPTSENSHKTKKGRSKRASLWGLSRSKGPERENGAALKFELRVRRPRFSFLHLKCKNEHNQRLNDRGDAKHAKHGGAFSSSEFSLYADVFSYLNSKLSLPKCCRP
jgi:hypothetical protein